MSDRLRDELEFRARVFAEIRRFFAERQVIEVDTPALSTAAATDPALESLDLELSAQRRHYLQTSPEHAMKRLIAAGSGDIYQVCRVFRKEELGRWHQPEFLLLEWYRCGLDEFALMDEVFELLQVLLKPRIPVLPRHSTSYREAFETTLGLNPLRSRNVVRHQLEEALASAGIDVPRNLGLNATLDLALSTLVVPTWPRETAVFLHDYPADQAALARVKNGEPPVAARFELFINGLELANGFHELADAREQRQRFEADLRARRRQRKAEPPIDEAFLAALERGLPDCAGVAVGIDRVIAVLAGSDSLGDVLNFPH